MAHITSNQTERLVAINKLLPELEIFLRETLEGEALSETTKLKREQLLSRLQALTKPPQLPPRGGNKILASLINEDDTGRGTGKKLNNDHSSSDFISKQREISWRQKDSDIVSIPPDTPAPYASKKRQHLSESEQLNVNKPSISSVSDETGIYEKIPSESGSGKYIDILNYDIKNGPPPVPERTHRSQPLIRKDTLDVDDVPSSKRQSDVVIHDLQNPSRTGPLKELRNNAKIWCVLKSKKLYIFKDLTHPASQVIDMSQYDVHIENMTKSNFRLSRPGFPSLLLAAENEEDYRQWITALEKCKYEQLDEIIPASYRNENYHDEIFDEKEEDHNYEKPLEIIAQVGKISQKLLKRPSSGLITNDITYVDMSSSQQMISDENNISAEWQPTRVDGIADLSYDAALPPIPTSSDEEYLGDHSAANRVMLKNRHLPALPSEDQVSGSFESLSSSSDEDNTHETKPRSSSGPPAYNIKATEKLTLDRRISGSLNRQQEKVKFFSDPDAVHCGILHQRRVLAVWQKRYCKVKKDSLLCYRNPENEDKPALEIYLPGFKIELCDKETWRSHSFKIYRPNTDTMYFAAETREQLMRWLSVLVKEIDKDKFSGKDTLPRSNNKGLLTPQPSGDTTSISSMEKRFGEEGSTCDADSESTESSGNEVDEIDEPEAQKKRSARKHSLKKRTNSERFQDPDAKLQGYLHRVLSNKWQRRWCVIKEERFMAYKVSPYDLPEIEVSLQTAKLVLPNELDVGQSGFYLIKLVWDDLHLLLLASTDDEWKKWRNLFLKYTESKSEENNLQRNLPKLPKMVLKLNGKEKKKNRARNNKKKPANNWPAVMDSLTPPIDVTNTFVRQKEFTSKIRILDSRDEEGHEEMCYVKEGIFLLSGGSNSTDSNLEIPIKDLRLQEENVSRDGQYLFSVEKSGGSPVILALDSNEAYLSLLEALWTQGAVIRGGEGTVTEIAVQKMKTSLKRTSIELNDGKRSLKSGEMVQAVKPYSIPDLKEPNDRTMSDGERRPRRLTKSNDKSNSGLADSRIRASSGAKSGGSRMSAFFRSLPKRNRKKYDFSSDVTDGLPKVQFSGTVKEIKASENGDEIMIPRLCKISGKIFYAYNVENELKPIFKVPLRNAAIEDVIERENEKFMFTLSSMEDRSSFQFKVETEESFDKWISALSLLDNPGGMSSRESLLDATKSDADVEVKTEVNNAPFSGSNSSNSLSSMLSKQAKNLGGSADEMKDVAAERKISEEVFSGNIEAIRHSGYLYELSITEKNDIKSRIKTRRWCVLRKSWIEIYKNETEKLPVRGIALSHHKLDALPMDEIGEKYAMCLRSEDEDFILCASNEEEFNKWLLEFKKVLKKQGRRTSDTAKQALRSASDGIRQLLSSSSLSGSGKRDSKRATIVLNEVDEKVVEKFTDDVESGNKISGVLTIVMKDGKIKKPKKRVCTIRDGQFCIAKRSKPSKIINTIELSNVAILDECDLEKGLFRFRLDYSDQQSMTFQTIDQIAADNWMVGISMAILLERLTSPEKFPHQEIEEKDLEQDPEMDDLGLINFSPVITRDARGSNSSNLSNDIKREIDRKISFGNSYLNPLSNLLESAFDRSQTRYSGSSASSSREGTLERDYGSGRFANSRKASGEAIKEEVKEELDEVDGGNDDVRAVENGTGTNGVEHKTKEKTNAQARQISFKANRSETSNENQPSIPSTGSVSSTVAKFEQLHSPREDSAEDNVFHAPYQVPDESEIEVKLADLLSERETLEKERNTLLDRLPDLRDVVRDAKERKKSESSSSEKLFLKKEYEVTNKDLDQMKTRLEVVNKRLSIIETLMSKKVPRISESFRTRTTVISPHIIV